MKTTMLKRFICMLCAALLLTAALPGAFGSEQSPEPPETAQTTEAAPAELSDSGEVPGEETAEDGAEAAPAEAALPEAESEEAAPAEPEEAAEAPEEASETPEEAASETPEASYEEPVTEPEDGDPMALRLAMQLDGGSKTFSDFTTRPLKNETLRKGIDISAWQASVNWRAVAASGVEFVILRAAYRTYGTGKLYKDSYFDANMRGAQAAGLRVGVYIFSQAITTAEAVEEADYLLSLVKDYKFELPLVFDFEYVEGGRLTSRLGKRLSTDICLAFCRRVEEAGYESMVYGNPSTLNGSLYPKEFGRVWLAHYITSTSYSGSNYEYWQCTGKGSVSGVEGDCDLDFWFEPKAKPAMPFTDVRTGDWFYESVLKAYQGKIVSGVTETTFKPNDTATRGQVATMVYRMQGEPAWTQAALFEDLTQTYYRNAIFWAAEHGVVNGYSETVFAPERSITREELVAILYRMKGKPAVTGDLSGFADEDWVQAYARDAMIWAVENEIISGYPNGTLQPRRNATRAEVCTILMRFAAM